MIRVILLLSIRRNVREIGQKNLKMMVMAAVNRLCKFQLILIRRECDLWNQRKKSCRRSYSSRKATLKSSVRLQS